MAEPCFFGDRWDAPIVDDAVQVPTPIGARCVICDRPVVDGDQGFLRPVVRSPSRATVEPVHRGCDMATTIGHIFGLCNCTGWDDIYERGRELIRRIEAGELRVP